MERFLEKAPAYDRIVVLDNEGNPKLLKDCVPMLPIEMADYDEVKKAAAEYYRNEEGTIVSLGFRKEITTKEAVDHIMGDTDYGKFLVEAYRDLLNLVFRRMRGGF